MAQHSSKIQGNIVLQKSLLGCPAQRPEQVEQILCSLGDPVTRGTASVGNCAPVQQQSLWLEVEKALQRLVQG